MRLSVLSIVLYLTSTALSAQVQWGLLNGPSGGSYSSIAYSRQDPRIIVVAPISSGRPLYTLNGGESWYEMQTFPVTRAKDGTFPPIRLYPRSRSSFWVQDKLKIMVTTDFGNTWTVERTLPNAVSFGSVEMHPEKDDLILMRSNQSNGETRLLSSLGDRWITMETLTPVGPIKGIRRILFDPRSTQVYIAQTEDGYVHSSGLAYTYFQRTGKVTLDGTVTGNVHAIDILNNWRLYGEVAGVVCVSTDRGKTWSAKSPVRRGSISGISQDTTDPNVIYAYGSEVWRSVDRGESWSLIDSVHPWVHDAYSKDGNLTMICRNLGLVKIMLNGTVVEHIDASIRRRPIVRMWQFGDNRMIGQTPTCMSITTDGGLSWVDHTGHDLPHTSLFLIGDVDLQDPDHIISSYYLRYPFFTTNSGATWDQSSFNGNYDIIEQISIDPRNGNNVISTSYSYLIRSSDGGSSFTVDSAIAFSNPRMITRSPADPSVILISEERGLVRSTDNGTSWRRFSNKVDRPINMIGHPNNASQFLYASHNGLFTSTNTGDTWTRNASLTFPIYAICLDSKNTDVLYAAGPLGRLYRLELSSGKLDTIIATPPYLGDTISISTIRESKGRVFATSSSGFYSAVVDPSSSTSDDQEHPVNDQFDVVRYYSISGQEIDYLSACRSRTPFFKVYMKRDNIVRSELLMIAK